MLGDWRLTLTSQTGNTSSTTHYTDISATILTLPLEGDLYMMEDYQRG